MSEYKCELCNYTFKNKFSLERHHGKKIKCNQKTEYKCDICKKSFKTNQNLKYHIDHNICDYLFVNQTENIVNDNDKTIIEILKGGKNCVFLLKALGLKMEDSDINQILESDISINSKLNIIKNNINIKTNQNNTITNSNNTNSNNTTNNILINNFGNETTEYLSKKYFAKLLIVIMVRIVF